MPKPPQTDDVGLAFERQVVNHYEALGFTVTHNANIHGHQIDLLAVKYVEPASHLTILIEAKYRTSKALGINEVTPFLNTARDLAARLMINSAVLITNKGFTQDARAAVIHTPNIQFLTIHQLEQESLNFSYSLRRIQADYVAQAICSTYVPLAGDPTGYARMPAGRETRVDDIATHALDAVAKWQPLLVITGDFGSGKSTIMDRIRFEQAGRRLADPDERYPILLKLRSMRYHSELWPFLIDALRDGQYLSPSRPTFEAQLKSGRFLLLMDGFDEINTSATARERLRYIDFLAPLLESGSPCIISTRPTYFLAAYEMNDLFKKRYASFGRIEGLEETGLNLDSLLTSLNLAPPLKLTYGDLGRFIAIKQLDEAGIIAYLRNREDALRAATGLGIEKIKFHLDDIYDLEDLMTRPLLLQMIVETILAGRVDIVAENSTLGPSKLYDIYTRMSAMRDGNRPKGILSEEERLEICRQFALRMLAVKSIDLSGKDAAIAIAESQLVKRKSKARGVPLDLVEQVITDVRTCTFLTPADDSGVLRFTHKSFFEFFLAQHICDLAVKNRLALVKFAAERLSREVIYFAASFVRDKPGLGEAILDIFVRLREQKAVRELLSRIIFASGSLLEGHNLVSVHVESADLRRIAVTGAYIRDSKLLGVRVRGLRAAKWQVIRTEVESSEISASSFTDSEIEWVGTALNVSEVEFEESQVTFRGKSWDVRSSVFKGGSLTLNGGGKAADLRAFGTRVRVCPEFKLGDGSDLHLEECIVYADDIHEWDAHNTIITLKNSTLLGLRLSAQAVSRGLGKAGKRRNATILTGAKGLVVLSSELASLNKASLEELRRAAPDLAVLDHQAFRDGQYNIREPDVAEVEPLIWTKAEVHSVIQRLGLEEALRDGPIGTLLGL